MFLKSLDIFGFKSFADRTHIDFSDGITALLGPNGCGKSNVVDAIKWVLAENKSKNLRAEKKEDVIFNGTERRAPLNVAEVTLTMSNESGLLPLDESEIAIKRRLYRNGENEYFINNKPVGARDVIKLFMDTGVGKSAYSVMEQGRIDQVLSSKPEDRRYLFEEAAGISRSKAEVQIAERELAQTKINLQQIEVVMAETKRTYDTLKVQSEKTTKYRKLKDEIFNFEKDIALLRLKNFVADKARHETELQEVTQKRDNVRKEIEEINNTISENMDKVKALQDRVYAGQAELIGIQKEKNGKLDLVNQFNARAGEVKEKIASLEVRQKSIKDSIDNLQDEIDEQEADLHQKEKNLGDVEKNIREFDENIKTAATQITQNDVLAAENKQKINLLNDKRSELQKELAAITEDIVTMLDSKLKDAGFSENALKDARQNFDSVLSRLKIFAEGRKNIFSDAQKNNLNDAQKVVQDALNAFIEIEKLIEELQSAFEKYMTVSPAFITEFLSPQGIMTNKREIDSKIHDNLAQIDEINKQIDDLSSTNSDLAQKIEDYKETSTKLKINKGQMEAQIESALQQTSLLRRNLSGQQSTLKDTEDELFQENKRFGDLNEQIIGVQEELSEIEQRGVALAAELNELDKKIAENNSNVTGKKDKLIKKQEEQNRLQGQVERLALSLNSSDTEIRNIKQNFQEQHSRDLMEFEERMYKITQSTAELRDKLSSAKEDLRALGSVNLMAVEEFAEIKDRYERQKASFDDTQKSLDNLIRVSEEIKSKSAEMFLETYNKIKKNFHNMFRRLFNGGRAELKLEDPQNILTSGIDILAQPPGKKLESIGLLSGGEKTMTAVALLFATYQVRPSPFCLLDEIDAALDDKNVSSFVTTLESFASVSQYIVITHNKKTVMGASTMLGITMEESGVSKIFALRLDEDIKIGKREKVEENDDFVEEDVSYEEDAFVPPRPPKRIYNEDGTITDTEIERVKKEEAQRLLEEKRRQREEKKALQEQEETENLQSEQTDEGQTDQENQSAQGEIDETTGDVKNKSEGESEN